MDKIIALIKKYWTYIVGALVGAIGGYAYWYYVGCSTGTCPITASPTTTTIWWAVIGALVVDIIFGRKKGETNNDNK